MKKVHYNETTNQILGWYSDDIHDVIPTPNIEVTEEVWQEALKINANYIDLETIGFSNRDFRTLEQLKSAKTAEINSKCEKEITSGFKSDALGTEHIYQSTETDQTNLMAMIIANEDDYFKCGTEQNDIITWTYELHTVLQFKTVHKEGKDIIRTLLQKCNTLKQQVIDATTVEEVNEIQW